MFYQYLNELLKNLNLLNKYFWTVRIFNIFIDEA